jgi:tripartite-type tricarboxylate transporter receptor subunit TctC
MRKNTNTLHRRTLLAAVLSAAAAPQALWAQSKPGRIVVPFPAGGPSDVMARLLADGYQRLLGTTYVVENKPGATGNIGAQDVARAQPDGLTLLLTNTAIVMNPALFTRTRMVDPMTELSPVSALGTTAFALIVPASAPERTLKDWLARMQAKPQVFYGSFGIGSSNHLYGHDFAGKTGLKGNHVPYKGDAPVLQDLIGGQLDFSLMSVGSAQRAGDRIKVLAVTGEQPAAQFPQAPTLKSQGVEGFEIGGWLGLFAPAGTPPDLRRRLAQATVEIWNQPEVRQKIEGFGLQPFGTTSERFDEMVRAEALRQGARIKASGAVLD